MTSVNAIEIATNNVVIDLNGDKLGGLAAGTGTFAYGIHAFQRKNITIRNGTVRGLCWGIWLDDVCPYTASQGHLVEDIRANMNTLVGMQVFGRGNIIRNNQVVNNGGSTHSNAAYGITVYGPDARVINNDVIETKEQPSGGAYGVWIRDAPGSVVKDNRIGNSSLGPGTSSGISIYSSISTDVLVSNNRVTTINLGVFYDTVDTPNSTGKYRDNLTSGCTTPYQGGTDVGGNN